MFSKKRKYIWLVLLVFSFLAFAGDKPNSEDLRKVENKAFKRGRKAGI